MDDERCGHGVNQTLLSIKYRVVEGRRGEGDFNQLIHGRKQSGQ